MSHGESRRTKNEVVPGHLHHKVNEYPRGRNVKCVCKR